MKLIITKYISINVYRLMNDEKKRSKSLVLGSGVCKELSINESYTL